MSVKKEGVLFTTDATITFDEYVRFSNYICRFANALSYILWVGIAGLLCVMAARSGKYPHAVMIAVGCITKVASSPAVRKQKQQKEFADRDSTGNCYVVYDFYEDGFIMTCNMEESDLARYCDMWSIKETKTNFYILYEPRNGCILIKENCSPELIRFLRYLKNTPDGPFYCEGVKATAQMGEEEDLRPELAKRFGFSYEIINWNTPADEVVNRYKKALQLAPVEGYPVIFENDERVLAVLDDLDEEIDRESLLEKELPDGKKLLEEWYRQKNEGRELSEYDFNRKIVKGTGTPRDTFIATEVCYRVFKNEDLIMLKIPVDAPWKLLAYYPLYPLSLYDLGNCPTIEEIMAVGKYWYERYRAVPAVFGCNILEFFAEDIRIITEDDAWQLAKEQTAFCDLPPELTTSGTVGELADDLTKTRTWYFMWEE